MKKLRASRGTSLTEMLVAIAVLGLLTLAVATGIAASVPVYQDATALSESSILASTLTQALQNELRYARDVQLYDDGTLHSYTSTNFGLDAAITNDNGHIQAGGSDLVGSGAYTTLAATADILYKEPYFEVTIRISDGSKTVRTVTFPVEPLNPVG